MKRFRLPALDTYLIMASLLVLTAILTWFVPGGEYDRVEIDGRSAVQPGSYHAVESEPQSFFDVFLAPIKGIVDAADIIGFILIVGGAFFVLQKTGAIDAAIRALVKLYERSRLVQVLIIPIFMTAFSLGGAVFGMSEETIPFVMLFVPLALKLGYDTITGVAIPFVGSGAGFAGAFLNPFTVGIAQGIADVPLFSGIEYRFIVWLIVTAVTIAYVMWHAARVKRDPSKSPTAALDAKLRAKLDAQTHQEGEKLDTRHRLVLLTFAVAMGTLVFGVIELKWYIEEIAALFLATGVVVGIIGGLRGTEITGAFSEGAKELVNTALIIGLARGILRIANDGKIIDPLLEGLSGLIDGFHPIAASQGMFVLQSAINLLVPSGSGQAALTMPIMAPLADLLGVTRQVAVLAFQFGDGFSNLIIPTSPVCMGILMVAGVAWEKWARWMIPLQIILLIVGFVLLVPPFFLNW